MRNQLRLLSVPVALAGSLLILAPGSGTAQPNPAGVPGRSYTQVIRLRPEMATEWVNLQRTEVIPALKKAGQTSRVVLTTTVGNAFEYLIFTPMPLWSAFDSPPPLVRALGAEGAAALNAKLRRCIQQQSSYMVIRNDSLSFGSADAVVWRTTVRRFVAGKRADYENLVRAEIKPAMQKAKDLGLLGGYLFSVRGAGAAANEFSETEQFTKFADLDAGNILGRALGGDQAASALNAKRAEFATTVQTVVRRRVADLSF